jgi:serine/threonine protein kinase
MINFDDIKIIKTLGSGMLGTTYLVKYINKEYALKIQHILEDDKNKDFKNEMWRELDVYEYINNLDNEDKLFFTKLHGYKIYNKCTHIQKRPFELKGNNEFVNKLKKLDESDWCVKYLLDYKGKMTLHKFLSTKKQTIKQLYSLMLQICKIIYILYEGGYSHNDLHSENIMINKTTKKYFNFMDKKIPYYGYQLSAIDFGEVLHKKFGIKYTGYQEVFIKNKERFLFTEIFYDTYHVIDNFSKNMDKCKKLKQKMPWERNQNIGDYIKKKILLKHTDFLTITKNKYFTSFPGSEKIFNDLMKMIQSKKYAKYNIDHLIREITKNKIMERDDFWHFINRIEYEFNLFFPEKYSKYFGWCSYYESRLPKNIVQDLLQINNYKDYINYLIQKIEE